MKLKSGKEEIVYLLSKVIAKYEFDSKTTLTKNSNRKNYEAVSIFLSEISNQLPQTAETLQHDIYPIDHSLHKQVYPLRKYDITSNQIKDAFYHQIVSNPRSFLVDSCYIYLYGIGKKGFGANPTDNNLVADEIINSEKSLSLPSQKLSKKNKILLFCAVFSLAGFLGMSYQYLSESAKWAAIRNDLKITPYEPTKAEIDSLEGIWLTYIGSPQARLSDENRFHIFAPNIVEFTYKNGYFTIKRYGVNFDHVGYAQFESPWLASIHTTVRNKSGEIESPRHSLMPLNKDKKYINVISTSWNFDIGDKNSIIGIREVYLKQGRNGELEEVMNTIENASCKCKIIRWHMPNGKKVDFQLKNQPIEQLSDKELQTLINEKSILLRVPKDGVLIDNEFNATKR